MRSGMNARLPAIVAERLHRRAAPVVFVGRAPQQLDGKHVVAVGEHVGFETVTVSPMTRLAAKRPPSTLGVTLSMTMRGAAASLPVRMSGRRSRIGVAALRAKDADFAAGERRARAHDRAEMTSSAMRLGARRRRQRIERDRQRLLALRGRY